MTPSKKSEVAPPLRSLILIWRPVPSAADDVPLSADDGLAAAKAQFNNPFLQLKSMFPYMADNTISGALVGRDVESAMLYLTTTLPIPHSPDASTTTFWLWPLAAPCPSCPSCLGPSGFRVWAAYHL